MVVDIPVQGGHDIRCRRSAGGLFELDRVERVRVRLGDDSDARPARVPEQCDARSRRLERTAEQSVGPKGRAQGSGVVPQFADLRGSFVDEREGVAEHFDRSRLKQRVVAAFGKQRCQRVGADVVTPEIQVDPSGVASAHFESVNGGECLLGNEIPGKRRG